MRGWQRRQCRKEVKRVGEEKPDYEIEFSEEMTEELKNLPGAEEMKIMWYIEQDPEKKVIEIRPGSEGCISLHGAQEVRFFIEVLEETIQQMF